MQRASQITEPDCAPLMDDMFFASGGDIPIDRFIAPRVEVELAFILGKPLQGPGITLFDVLSATEYVSPAIEIIDARIEQFDRDTQAPRKVFDTISDFAANAGIVLGGRPVRPLDVDLRWVGALLHKNGVIEETGVAAGVLNHPGNGVAWLANRIAPHGMPTKARDLASAAGKTVLLLRNHGPVAIGQTVAQAFPLMWTVQRACEVQLASISMGAPSSACTVIPSKSWYATLPCSCAA